MKPNWSTAPAWANYAAMDEDGAWYWYGKKPEVATDCWAPAAFGVALEFEACTSLMDWHHSLEERPVEAEEGK